MYWFSSYGLVYLILTIIFFKYKLQVYGFKTESESLSNLSKLIQMIIGSEVRLAFICSIFYQKINSVCMCVYTYTQTRKNYKAVPLNLHTLLLRIMLHKFLFKKDAYYCYYNHVFYILHGIFKLILFISLCNCSNRVRKLDLRNAIGEQELMLLLNLC